MKQEPNQPDINGPVVQQQPQQRIWGEGALPAALRQGHKEVAPLFEPMFDSNIKVVEEPGGFSNVPSAGVSQQAGYTQPATRAASQAPMVTSHGETQPSAAPAHGFRSSLGQVVDRLQAVEPSPQMSKEISR